MGKKAGWLFCLLVIVMGVSGGVMAAEDPCAEPVKTVSGLVGGMADPGGQTCVWKGIPFAAAPVGELRFKAPQPASSWSGIRDATKYGPACIQLPEREDMSEDCLYLNIWRPKKSGVFPVMVWIHGGGYVMGSASGGLGGDASYDGAKLSAFGEVVVVTINYRLHVFGFLADPALRQEDPNQSTGNYGSLDQVAALRWVHENIASFGGDPGNVTIFGESAGGASVCTMLASPLNHGLFHRAILESGSCTMSENLEKGYERAKIVAKRAGCAPSDIACLRKAPVKKLLGGLPTLYKEGMAYMPHHDGYLLTDTPINMIRGGKFNQVPFLAGFNRNEFDAVLILRPKLWYALPSQYESRLKKNLALTEEELKQLVALYPLSQFGNQPRKAYGAMYSDAGLICPTYFGLLAAADFVPATYLYRFDYDEMKGGKFFGALHAMEVPFVFGAINETSSLYDEKNIGPAKELMRIIQGYWTNFAKNADPNGPGLPTWPRFRREEQKLLVLDTQVRAETFPNAERCAFWERYLPAHTGINETLGRDQKK